MKIILNAREIDVEEGDRIIAGDNFIAPRINSHGDRVFYIESWRNGDKKVVDMKWENE